MVVVTVWWRVDCGVGVSWNVGVGGGGHPEGADAEGAVEAAI